MNPNLLDELIVPQPPYRMPRAVLAVSDGMREQLARLAGQGELPVPPASEQVPPQELSLVEAIEQQEAAIEAAARAEKEKITAAPPVAQATEQEAAQDRANRQKGAEAVEAAAAEGVAEVRKQTPAPPILEGVGPSRTPEQKARDAVIAASLKKDQENKAEGARTQAGGKFTETLNQQVSRLSQDALAKLNEYKDLQEKGALVKPEAVAVAKQKADIAQRKLAAAQRGEGMSEVVIEHQTPSGRVYGRVKNMPPIPGSGFAAAEQAVEALKPQVAEKERKDREIAEAQRKLIEELKARVAELEARPVQAENTAQPERSEEEPAEQGPATKVVTKVLEDIVAQEAKGSLGERLESAYYQELHGINRWWWSVLAKRSKDKLAATDQKIKKLDAEEKAFVEKSYLHTAVAPLWYGVFGGKWHGLWLQGRFRLESKREDYAASLEKYHHRKERRERDLIGMHDLEAAMTDVPISQAESKAKKWKHEEKALEEELKKQYTAHNDFMKELSSSTDPQKYAEIADKIGRGKKIIAALNDAISTAKGNFAEANGEAADLRAKRDELISRRDESTPDTSFKLEHEEAHKKPGRKLRLVKAA